MYKAPAGRLALPQLLSFLFQPVELRLVAVYFLKDRLKSRSKSRLRGWGRAHGRQSFGPKTAETNAGEEQTRPKGVSISKLHTMEGSRTRQITPQRKAGALDSGKGAPNLRTASPDCRVPPCPWSECVVDEGGSDQPGAHHLQFLLFSSLGWQIIQAIAASMNHLLGFTQPVLHRLSAYFKVLHLDLQILWGFR